MSILNYWAERRIRREIFAGLPFAPGSAWHELIMGVLKMQPPSAEAIPRPWSAMARLARDTARYARASGSIEHADALETLAERIDLSKEL